MVAFMRWLAGFALLVLVGCDASGQLCRDTALRLAERDSRCGWAGPGQAGYETLLGGSDCSQVVPVRDAEALVEVCWPALDSLACSETPSLPEACDDQF